MTDRTSPRLERVVVAVDFTDPSREAVAWVAQSFARGAQIVLVHVIEHPPLPSFLIKRYPATEQIVESARAAAETQLRSLSGGVATGLVWLEARTGKADVEVVRTAADYGADLIVVGRSPQQPQAWGRVGATAQRILRRSHVPVIVAGGPSTREPIPAPSYVVAAVDDSALTDHVLAWGAFVARRFSTDGTALHVLTMPLFPGASALAAGLGPVSAVPPAEAAELEQRAAGEAREWLTERVRRSTAASVLRPTVVSGGLGPVQAIVEEAARRDGSMIVIGSRGSGGADRLVFGSVAEAVLREATCPVLIVVEPLKVRRPHRAPARSRSVATGSTGTSDAGTR
jgi:nucleotide-binding universal stress UspA family protein